MCGVRGLGVAVDCSLQEHCYSAEVMALDEDMIHDSRKLGPVVV